MLIGLRDENLTGNTQLRVPCFISFSAIFLHNNKKSCIFAAENHTQYGFVLKNQN